MKLSTKGRYAVMAMADIASRHTDKPVSLAEIAASQNISQEYLEQLFSRLRKAGLVTSVRGPGGGYRLARDPDEIFISDIISAADEPLSVTRCPDGDGVQGCQNGEACITHELWSSLRRQIWGFLSSVTLGDVVEKRNLALAAEVRRSTAMPPRVARG
ncbi:Rrf2 family transcriptional regulator [Thermopetrobacter sp. TC1]|uniref:Rrf2 family transcriptional regulator n=1 Tax=Thermopetrobacter sp. TC1 TaxID=1495045 RepID=UPI000571C9BD|nr:Rrf2 family transcriptional regulator [Thermopetrobacter sp. TC1]